MGEELDPTIPAPDEDPTEDNPVEPSDDKGADNPTDTAPVDWETQYKRLQADRDRRMAQIAAKERALAAREQALRVVAPEPEPGAEDLATLPPHLRREVEEARAYRAQAAEFEARQAHGDLVVDSIKAHFDGPVTTDLADAVVGLIEDLAKAQQTATAAASKRSRSQAVQPRVDTNRPDAPDQTALDKQIEDAKAGKGKDPLGALVSARLRKAGF